MFGDEELPPDLLRGLLSKQRLLVIVDALSERDGATQRHVEGVFAEGTPVNALIVTSRRELEMGAVDRTTLYPERLTGDRLIPFIFEYLNRRRLDTLFPPRLQVQLGERVLALAEAGGSATTVTPLLAALFVDSAVNRARGGQQLEDMPDVVPELFLDYLRRLNPMSGTPGEVVAQDVMIRAARLLAIASLGTSLIPGDFRRADAEASLADCGLPGEPERLIERLLTNGVLELRMPAGIPVLRFNLDPAAEYLAAIEHIDSLKSDRAAWLQFVAGLERTNGYPTSCDGFLAAFATCYRAYRVALALPEIDLPWEHRPKEIPSSRVLAPRKSRRKESPDPGRSSCSTKPCYDEQGRQQSLSAPPSSIGTDRRRQLGTA
jgi:hypothetical protein